MTERIPVAGPWITQKEVDYVADAAANAWYSNAGSYNARFEAAFAAYVGRKHAISLPSCTSAIHLALLAAGVGPGDEVIVPDITWIASAAPITYVGATPVFADVDPQTWCLSVDGLRACITSRTKAVIPVDLYGGMPDMDGILEVARKHAIAVIEDAAEAVGSEYRGRKAGSFGVASVFSFHGSKTLTTGEGGMLVADDGALIERALVLRDHGRRPGDHSFRNQEVAYKYKMSALQAALGLAQLERIDEMVSKKRQIFDWYRSAIADAPGVQLNAEPEGTRNSYWMVTALFDAAWGGKEAVAAHLSKQQIDTRPMFSPLSSLPAYAGSDQARSAARQNAVSYAIGGNGVNLPSALNLSHSQVQRVCSVLRALAG
jgi:perosamine synthetase